MTRPCHRMSLNVIKCHLCIWLKKRCTDEIAQMIIGIDNKMPEMDAFAFLGYVRRNYLVGDWVTINLIRNGNQMTLR